MLMGDLFRVGGVSGQRFQIASIACFRDYNSASQIRISEGMHFFSVHIVKTHFYFAFQIFFFYQFVIVQSHIVLLYKLLNILCYLLLL